MQSALFPQRGNDIPAECSSGIQANQSTLSPKCGADNKQVSELSLPQRNDNNARKSSLDIQKRKSALSSPAG